MTIAGFIARQLFAKPTRSALTLVSLAIAFLLYVLLRAVAAAFSAAPTAVGPQRVYVDARYSMTDNLPQAYLAAIARIEGVESVTPMIWFGGYYQEPVNAFAKIPVDPVRFFEVFPEVRVTDETLARFQRDRRAVVAAAPLAERFGWRSGDVIPLIGDIWPRADGSWHWEFELAGTYAVPEDARIQPMLLMRQDYFDEAVADWVKGQFGWAVVRIADGLDPQRVIDAIDAQFENSSDPTRSLAEDDYQRQFATQLGDIGAITSLILGAVFFTILLLTGNVVSLGFHERIGEFAVLKTLGFRDSQVAGFVLAESLALCVAGALAGIAIGLGLEGYLRASLAPVLGPFRISVADAGQALAIAAALGLATGVPPALRARRLAIVDALRRIG